MGNALKSSGNAVSGPFVPPFSKASADPSVVDVMRQAYSKACKMLHDKGQPLLVQEVIADRIIEMVRTGERDPDRICVRVITDLGLQRN